jgi:hypothetical protein
LELHPGKLKFDILCHTDERWQVSGITSVSDCVPIMVVEHEEGMVEMVSAECGRSS